MTNQLFLLFLMKIYTMMQLALCCSLTLSKENKGKNDSKLACLGA
jgi:hypothetical protein